MQSTFRILGALALGFVLFSGAAHADRRAFQQRVVLGSQLMAFQTDAGLGVSNVTDGRIDIDLTGRIARLVLMTPAGQSFAVTAPVVSMTRDTCGAALYTAVLRGNDAQTLLVRDNTDNSRCAYAVPTEVTLTRTVGSAQPSVSRFTAERLSRQGPNYIIDDTIDGE